MHRPAVSSVRLYRPLRRFVLVAPCGVAFSSPSLAARKSVHLLSALQRQDVPHLVEELAAVPPANLPVVL
jgi:hypothetical protein